MTSENIVDSYDAKMTLLISQAIKDYVAFYLYEHVSSFIKTIYENSKLGSTRVDIFRSNRSNILIQSPNRIYSKFIFNKNHCTYLNKVD